MQTAKELEQQQALDPALVATYERIGIEMANRIREALENGLMTSEGLPMPQLASNAADAKNRGLQVGVGHRIRSDMLR